MCVYIYIHIHVPISIYTQTNRGLTQHIPNLYPSLCKFFQDISVLGNLSFQGHMQTVFLFETECSLHKLFTRRQSMIFFSSQHHLIHDLPRTILLKN